MRIYYFLILCFAALFSTCEQKSGRIIPDRKGVIAQNAMVVSAHPLASKVGVDILKKGGNAIDAAVAVHFALAVVYPSAGNIGGGGFLIYRTNSGEFYSLDYREKAPAFADRDMYLDDSSEVENEKSLFGHLAAGVPGSVEGMVTVHKRFGSMAWEELLTPAIEMAKNGFLLTEKEANNLNRIRDRLLEVNTLSPEYLLKEAWNEYDTIYYQDLANTLERIKRDDRAGFYEGETARLIVDEMIRGNGLITYEDLANYTSVWREPIQFNYQKYRITSMGPPSSGGVAIAQLFSMIEQFPIDMWGIDHINTIHAITEIEKLVYADRAQYLGDPDFSNIPINQLLNSRYNQIRASMINFENATPSDEISAGQFMVEHEQTTHFSIIDQFGNAVSSTTTLNGGFGNHVVVGGAGFFLNNEMDDFSVKPGSPNMYGLIGGEANAIAPNKRMLSSMTPTIVEKEDELYMVLGTPGGSTIITSVFQTVLNVIDFNLHMQGAVDFQRFHHQWYPDYIQYEQGRFNDVILKDLKGMGHNLRERSSIGRVDAILVLEDGSLEGAADPRGDDTALGF